MFSDLMNFDWEVSTEDLPMNTEICPIQLDLKGYCGTLRYDLSGKEVGHEYE